ncbi:MAG: CARDB domain-containing protein [Candidatus Thermoplasmatota archaeon]|nr:CARDB domain-containing protein [Candidatus Thermoplasmatota archaeon]
MSRKITALLLAMLMLPLSAMNTLADENDPDLSINEISFDDDSPTGGDDVTITAEIANDGGTSGLISVTTNVSFYVDSSFIGKETITIPGGNTADAEIEWTAVGGTHTVKIIVDEEELISESDEDNNEATETITASYPPILLLDDDNSPNNGGSRTETDQYYVNALDNLTNPIAYDVIRVNSSADAPGIDTLSEYQLIIWACGTDYQSGDTDVTFTDNDKTNVGEYLEGGGAMWVIGMDILYDFDTTDGERSSGDFEYDYLGVSYADNDRATPTIIYGVDGDPISDGVEYDADAISSDFADDINPRSGFEKVLSSNGDYNISTIRTEDEFKLVFMTIDFSSITSSDDRDEFMENVLEYLVEQLENDVSLSRFNSPKDGETVEPNVDNIVNVTVRNRGTEDQNSIQVSLEITCLNNSYTFTDSETISLDAGTGTYVEFEWDTPDDEDYVYQIKSKATISDDEKDENNEKIIKVNTYVTYDLEVKDARVTPMIAEKDEEREMSVIVTNSGDVTMNSEVSGKIYDGAGNVIDNLGNEDIEDLAPGESLTLTWDWETDDYGTFWFEAKVIDEDDEIPENDVIDSIMRSVDVEFSDDMEDGINGWSDYKSLSNPWHLIDTDEDSNREASSPTHAMWVGDESKGDGEYDNNWDFSVYTSEEIALGQTNPQMSVDIWYSTEFSWDGGNVQITTNDGETWEVINPDGGYPDDAVVGLDNEPGYTGTSGEGDTADWETASFSLANYTNQDVRFKFRFGTDSSVEAYEGWYIDNIEVSSGTETHFEDDFEDGDGDWMADIVESEWNYYSNKSYSGDNSWYLGNPETETYSASLNDSLESPTFDIGDGAEKYVSAMVWFAIDGPNDFVNLEINQSGEWELLETFPGDDGDYSSDYDGADENGWLYFESDVSEYEDDVSFRLRFESNTFTQLEGLYVDNFAVYSLPPIPNDVGTKKLDSPNTAKPGRTVTFTSEIYNFGTNDQDDFDVRGTVTRDDGTEVYNETQTIDSLESKTNSTLEWTWEGGPEGTYTIRVETLLTGDERAGNNPKEENIDIAESGYNVALAVQDQAKDVLSGESVAFNFTATNTGENSGYYDISLEAEQEDDWKIISHVNSIYLTAGSSENFSVVVIAPTLEPTGNEHSFTVTVTSRDDPETEDSSDISATPFYYSQEGGDKVLLIDANFGKNNGYNNYYDVDKIDTRLKFTLQQYFTDGESRGYDVYTIPYDSELGSFGELGPYPTIDLMSDYDVVIWTQGDHNQRNITSWKECIRDYLDQGGSLWIMGQQFLTALNGSDGPRQNGDFEYDYFMIDYIRNNVGTPNPLVGVEDDEIFGDAEYDMGDTSIYFSDYSDWIRPRDEAIGAFYTDRSNWWHIVDTVSDPNRKANSPTHSMWIGDESKGDGEYKNGWDYSVYTANQFTLGNGAQLTFQHYYDTESESYAYDGGNVQISTDGGVSWEVIQPNGGYPAQSVTGLDGEPGYYGQSNGWVQATFDLSNFSNEEIKLKWRFGADGVIDTYEGWYFDDVELTSNGGTTSHLSDDMEDGMDNWDIDSQVFNMSLHYEGDYRLIVSPFTFGKINTSNDREDMVGRALDWLRASAAADDVGVKVLKIESDVKENSTIYFSSIIKNYGSETQSAIDVRATIFDSEGNEIWNDNQQIIGPLESGEEETLEWQWESNNPGEFTIIVETTKEDENHRNNDKEIDFGVEMIHLPEISTFNHDKEGEPGAKLEFNIVIKNSASGTDTFYLDMVGAAEDWGSMTNQMEMKSNESKDIELQITIPEDAEYELYDLTIILTAGDVTETLELTIDVTDDPTNYEVEITASPTNTESVAGQEVEFSVTIYNKGDGTDTFDLEILGDESEWVEFEENGITVEADDQATVNGIISIPDDQEDGNVYIEIEVTSRGDETAKDDKTIRVSVEELETGVTLRREGSGLRTIAPGESDVIEFNVLSDGNGKQTIEVTAESEAGNWVVLSPAAFDLDVEDSQVITATVNVPSDTSDATYRLEILVYDDKGNELAKSISNIVVQTPIEEIQDVSLCFADLSNLCLDSANFEITIEASKIQTTSAGFIIENKGTVDVDVALELIMPDGSKDTDLYFDENSKEWRVAISPSDTKDYPLKVKSGDKLDWGALAVIAREVLPGTYTYTLNILAATESATGGYAFEVLDQITLTVKVEGEIASEETVTESEDSLLPGPSFISVVGLLALIVYRRKN